MEEIKRRRHSSSSKWACLHRDVIDSILDRLVLVSDLIRFSAVCKSWNCLSLNYYKEKRILAINHQLPWVIIQPSRLGPEIHNFFDLTSSKISDFPFEFDRDRFLKRCYRGSSHGWLLVMVGYDYLMFNPISGSSFRLPSLILCSDYRGLFRPTIVSMVTLSRDPSTCEGSPLEVLVSSSLHLPEFDVMAHWKSGDKFWTYSETSDEEGEYYFRFLDFIFYKDRMLGISSMCKAPRDVVDVISINIDNSQAHSGAGGVGRGGIKIKKIASTPRLVGLHCEEGYLVETTKGELLMVHRYYNTIGYDIIPFGVYKVIICSNDDSAKIIPIKNLDGDSLFLGKYSQSISVFASNYPACMPNSIYYVSDDYSSKKIEVFNVEDGTLSYSLIPTGYRKTPGAPWIVPSMKL